MDEGPCPHAVFNYGMGGFWVGVRLLEGVHSLVREEQEAEKAGISRSCKRGSVLPPSITRKERVRDFVSNPLFFLVEMRRIELLASALRKLRPLT